jgi:hypothetical protein
MRRLVWEGVKKKENCCIIGVEGEELGALTIYYDEHETRGIVFRVFRTADGNILIHKYQWGYPPVPLKRWANERDRVPTTEEPWALVYVFPSLAVAAEAGFHGVLKRLNLI